MRYYCEFFRIEFFRKALLSYLPIYFSISRKGIAPFKRQKWDRGMYLVL